ncbi:MAG: hypothetical protein V5787_02305 [Flavicella sp.]
MTHQILTIIKIMVLVFKKGTYRNSETENNGSSIGIFDKSGTDFGTIKNSHYIKIRKQNSSLILR